MKIIAFSILVLLACGCTPLRQVAAEPPPETAVSGTMTPVPTPTLPPTAVPGTSADRAEVQAVVAQFGAALVDEDELVALLVLSPSAQKVVAATSLPGFLGQPAHPTQATVGTVQLQADVARADLELHYPAGATIVRLQLVRLDGQWRIDARADT